MDKAAFGAGDLHLKNIFFHVYWQMLQKQIGDKFPNQILTLIYEV